MKYFKLRELYVTRQPYNNTPPVGAIAKLRAVVDNVLDPLREAIGTPITITSGYRSPEVNRAIGGSKTSQHMLGEAVDFVCKDMASAFAYILEHLPYDQLIWEFGTDDQPAWIHLSYKADSKNRRQALRASKTPAGKTYYTAYNKPKA